MGDLLSVASSIGGIVSLCLTTYLMIEGDYVLANTFLMWAIFMKLNMLQCEVEK